MTRNMYASSTATWLVRKQKSADRKWPRATDTMTARLATPAPRAQQ
ncbi:MAG TPA: hypothetical protein VGM75_22575 [Pseudonocardiaceae bacterium]